MISTPLISTLTATVVVLRLVHGDYECVRLDSAVLGVPAVAHAYLAVSYMSVLAIVGAMFSLRRRAMLLVTIVILESLLLAMRVITTSLV